MKYLKFKEGDNTTELNINGLKVRYFAGIPTICYNDGSFAYYNGKKECFVGGYKGVYAHGNTQEKANEMAEFWAIKDIVNKEELVESIKKKGKITILEFKLLTNLYCEVTDRIIERMSLDREFPISVAIEMAKINTESNELMTKYFG